MSEGSNMKRVVVMSLAAMCGPVVMAQTVVPRTPGAAVPSGPLDLANRVGVPAPPAKTP